MFSLQEHSIAFYSRLFFDYWKQWSCSWNSSHTRPPPNTQRGQMPEHTWNTRNDSHSTSPLCPLFPIAVFMYSQSPVGKSNIKRGVQPARCWTLTCQPRAAQWVAIWLLSLADMCVFCVYTALPRGGIVFYTTSLPFFGLGDYSFSFLPAWETLGETTSHTKATVLVKLYCSRLCLQVKQMLAKIAGGDLSWEIINLAHLMARSPQNPTGLDFSRAETSGAAQVTGIIWF